MGAHDTPTHWYKDAVIYELHVKAFRDSDGDGVGDFRGLMEKLDYLQDLGITAIWLLPFYPSPMRDDGYDIADFRGIHPAYGTRRDFKALIREAHRRGLRVITELVVNHTSDQHPWFQAARRARPGSARREMYVWSDDDRRFPETRIIFTDSESSNWTWDPVAGAYYWHRFFSHQPDLNHNNPRVVREVIRVMRYWFDMGVDGMRLDAVPYLCVRDGTSNENLPETHDVIRRFRRAVDERYDDKMLLAEANQWPEDVRPYFGDGDQTHMAFHFPLMPRIFMALRQEDRHPITEILAATPEIPPACQWALFLRNHDELTLEMVTDAERDYMYREYGTDPRMRLNVGIRRRLAPLMDDSMRRIELLNSLLFSLPGTPIIYYGDEIGMGDNIYLGDRDGVRTPMQWSPDRNAGFSSADPAQLYLPVIMDPVYGYTAINVEAQQRNPSSLLHFMRRMLGLRRQHKAFGRGTLEVLHPENRAVLAYLRRYRGEVILVVANLSRYVQPVELDLREHAGLTPVEMIGRAEFPTLGDQPFFLSLGPHSFCWFHLDPQPEPVGAGEPGDRGADPAVPRVELSREWRVLVPDEARRALGDTVLPAYLPRQRWFRGKARGLARVEVEDWCKLGAGFYQVLARAEYDDGGAETYSVPLLVAMGDAARRLARTIPGAVMAHLRTPRGEGVICDALADRTSCVALFRAFADGRRFATPAGGEVRFFPTRALGEEQADEAGQLTIRPLRAEQSNTSMILGDRFVLKAFRVVEAGPNPDLEIGRFLTERTAFDALAPVAGGMEYRRAAGEEPSTLAMLQAFVPNQGDGWSYVLGTIRHHLEECARQGHEAVDPDPGRSLPGIAGEATPGGEPPETMAGSVQALQVLARRTAELHLAMAGEQRLAAFRPRPLDEHFTGSMAGEMVAQAQHALALLEAARGGLPEGSGGLADEVLAAGGDLIAELRDLSGRRFDAVRIRCHGDYHLGQVLRAEDDFVLLDFEGEPQRELVRRGEPQPALKDVAGMLRSLSYAANEGLRELVQRGLAEEPLARGWIDEWERWAGAAFLGTYLRLVEGSRLVPPDPAERARLLRAQLLDKALYELIYELNNRPDWVQVPLTGLAGLARMATRRTT